jgi:putative flippase GtrA
MKLPRPPWYEARRALGFVLFSGLGWCLDMCVFFGLVHALALPSGLANLISATTAAMAVFVVSRVLLFDRARRSVKPILGYFFYSEVNILLSAAVIEAISLHLSSAYTLRSTTAAIAAKIMVTPLSLACNFFVTRWISGKRADEQ